VITLPIGRALCCEKLYITSVSGYVPFEWRKTKPLDSSNGVFSPQALDIMCKRLHTVAQNVKAIDLPRKVFLRRNSVYRNVINSIDVEELFLSHGYTIIEPEKMTFTQQVEIFRNAKTIVSPTGAALANILFAPKDTKIFILISKHPDTIYWYWQNIACVQGKDVKYVFGNLSGSKASGIHASFMINLDDLVSIISEAND
jgi:capsular polysaccharide biosynthesis protein